MSSAPTAVKEPNAPTPASNGAVPLSTLDIRDRMRARKVLRSETVPVPEYDIVIEVRDFTLGERTRLMTEGYDRSGAEAKPIFQVFYPLLLIFACYNPANEERIWQDTPDDRAFINGLSSSVSDRLTKAAMKVAGLATEGNDPNGSGGSPIASTSSLSPKP